MKNRYRLTATWVTAAKIEIPVVKMNDQHLLWVMDRLKEWSIQKRAEILAEGEGYYSHYDSWEIFAPNIFFAMRDEALHRKLITAGTPAGARVIDGD